MHRTTIHVRWSELDPYHHVNHATYLSYLEHARIGVLDAIGWNMETLERAGYRVVVARIDIGFRQAARAGDTLEVTSTVTSVGASASSWRQVLTRDDTTLVEATVEAACTDLKGKPVRMPAELRHALTELVADPSQ
jgi:acyl-CoA thioester hydrolase